MRRAFPLIVLVVAIAAGRASSDDPKSLARLNVPDESMAACKAIQGWLQARGFDCELKGDNLIFHKETVRFNIHPFVAEKELDRLVVSTLYTPKDEFKGSKELAELAVELNRSQNFLRVFLTNEGLFAASTNLTFYDEFTAHEFDAFLDLYAGVLKRYVLTKEAVKMLK